MLQIATGICLALVYVPSADEAYQSLQYLNYQAPFGWYLRAMHFWGSNAMVAVMTLHMIQVFLFGAHKYPREMTWVVGLPALPVHARHGLHRPGAALGPGRVLGARHQRVDRRALAGDRRSGGARAPRRARSSRGGRCRASSPCTSSPSPGCSSR
jgi:hypothetical protein